MISVKKLLSYFCFGLFLTIFGNGQTSELSILQVDVPVEREISKDEVHRFKIALQTNDFGRVVVAQQHADIVLRVLLPTDKNYAMRIILQIGAILSDVRLSPK